MNATPATDSARITWKDALIILFLMFYAWFSYDEEDSPGKRPPQQHSAITAFAA